MAHERVLNPLKRKVLRHEFPRWETRFGIAFPVLLAVVGLWVLAQRDAYDPADRDIATEVLAADAVEDTLYHAPMIPWREPGAGTAAASPDLGIFPPELLAGGWAVDGRVETYDPDTVYEKINGAAEQYLAFGFERLHYVTITDGRASITTEVYDQGRFANTLGIFAAQRSDDRAVATDDGLFSYATPVGAVAGIGRYYLKVAADRQDEAVVAKARSLVPALASLPAGSDDVPLGFRLFADDLGVGFGDIAFVASDAFQFAFASDFWFAAAPGGQARYFLHEATSPGEARDLFGKIVEEQSWEHTVVEQDDGRAVMQHDFLGTLFVVQTNGPFVFGVEGAADRAAADTASRSLQEVLRGEI